MPGAKFTMINGTIQSLLSGCKYSTDCQGNSICCHWPLHLLSTPPLPSPMTAGQQCSHCCGKPTWFSRDRLGSGRFTVSTPSPGILNAFLLDGDLLLHCVLPKGWSHSCCEPRLTLARALPVFDITCVAWKLSLEREPMYPGCLGKVSAFS